MRIKRDEEQFLLSIMDNFFYTSPVNSTGRPSLAAFTASNFPSSLSLTLFADQSEEAPFQLPEIKKLGSSRKSISQVYIWNVFECLVSIMITLKPHFEFDSKNLVHTCIQTYATKFI